MCDGTCIVEKEECSFLTRAATQTARRCLVDSFSQHCKAEILKSVGGFSDGRLLIEFNDQWRKVIEGGAPGDLLWDTHAAPVTPISLNPGFLPECSIRGRVSGAVFPDAQVWASKLYPLSDDTDFAAIMRCPDAFGAVVESLNARLLFQCVPASRLFLADPDGELIALNTTRVVKLLWLQATERLVKDGEIVRDDVALKLLKVLEHHLCKLYTLIGQDAPWLHADGLALAQLLLLGVPMKAPLLFQTLVSESRALTFAFHLALPVLHAAQAGAVAVVAAVACGGKRPFSSLSPVRLGVPAARTLSAIFARASPPPVTRGMFLLGVNVGGGDLGEDEDAEAARLHAVGKRALLGARALISPDTLPQGAFPTAVGGIPASLVVTADAFAAANAAAAAKNPVKGVLSSAGDTAVALIIRYLKSQFSAAGVGMGVLWLHLSIGMTSFCAAQQGPRPPRLVSSAR